MGEDCKIFRGGRKKSNKSKCQERHKKQLRQDNKTSIVEREYDIVDPVRVYLSGSELDTLAKISMLKAMPEHLRKRRKKLLCRLSRGNNLNEEIHIRYSNWRGKQYSYSSGFKTDRDDLEWLISQLGSKQELIEKLRGVIVE